jgi:cyclophilin family peptidyl-prolyl cis-trans isomerase
VPGFVVQFGLAADPRVTAQWKTRTIPDDPVRETNSRGTIVFATAGANTRTTQLFINLGSNSQLDHMGFSPFGSVEQMDVVEGINMQYREQPQQGMITEYGTPYLKQNFPKLDYIVSTTLIQ